MKHISRNLTCASSVTLLLLGLSTEPSQAVTPCFADPCTNEQSTKCKELSDWIAEGTLVEMRYRSEPVPYMVPIDPPVYQQLLTELIFVPDKVVKGMTPKGEVHLRPYTICWPAPDLHDMRPMRLRIYARQSANGAALVHFVRLGK